MWYKYTNLKHMQDLKGAMEVVISLREEVRNPASGNPLEKLEGAGSSDQLTRGDFSVYRGCVW